MKITISKKQWEQIGGKTDLVKTAQIDNQQPSYTVDNLISELEKYRGFKIAMFSEEHGDEFVEKGPLIAETEGHVLFADVPNKRMVITT